jgi:hypothetical protein
MKSIRTNRRKPHGESPVKLTRDQIVSMRIVLQHIVHERPSPWHKDDPQHGAKHERDLNLIAGVKSVENAIDVLGDLGKDIQSELTVWAEILDPLGGFNVADDSPEEQERFRQYLHTTYNVPLNKLKSRYRSYARM